MKINTYAVNCNDAWLNTEGDDISGSYVKYKDHQEVVAAIEAKCAALAADNEKAMEAMRQADAAVKLAHEKFSALAEENAKLKEFISLECMVFGDSNNLLVAEPFIPQTPATDAFLAEVRAQGVEAFANSLKVAGGHEHPYSAVANEFSDQLRKGGNQ